MERPPQRPSEPGWKSEWRLNLEAGRRAAAAEEAQRDRRLTALRGSQPTPAVPGQNTAFPLRRTGQPSRQVLWQRKQVEKGLCRLCNCPLAANSRSLCAHHLAEARKNTGLSRLRN